MQSDRQRHGTRQRLVVAETFLSAVSPTFLLVSLISLFGCTVLSAASQIERFVPETVKASAAFGVTNVVTAGEEVLVYAVEETVPPGWSVGRITTSGFVDITHGKIKWGPFFDHQTRLLSYELISPPNFIGDVMLNGSGSFNGELITITGRSRIRVESATGSTARDEVTSLLPERFVPGEPLMLTNKVALAEVTIVYSVEDSVPVGWQAGLINHGGKFDTLAGKIKWGPFSDRVPRELVCELKPPLGLTNSVVFVGSGSFNGQTLPISGQRVTVPVTGAVVSEMPAHYQAGEQITIKLVAKPVPTTRVFAVQEQVPSGWTIGQISHNGEFDAKLARIKWGPFFTNGVTTLTYRLTAPAAIDLSNNTVIFSGLGSFDGVDFAVSGQREMTGISSQVVRMMTPEFLAGAPFTVTNRVSPDPTVTVYAVEDEVPPDVTARDISHQGFFDGATRRIKWGPFLDAEARTLIYTITPPKTAGTILSFRGTASFNKQSISIAGQQETRAVLISALNTVQRTAPASVRASRSIVITNRVTLGASVSVYAIEDQLPAGWTATNISHDGVFDQRKSKVKWGPFFDATPRTLAYAAVAPTNAGGRVTFTGTASFNSEQMAITGASNVLAIANYRPIAREDSFEQVIGQPLIISAAALMANDNDPDDDPISLFAIERTSAGGGVVAIAEETITYSPPTTPHDSDSFTYTISDSFGGFATGVVRIKVVTDGPSQNRWRIETFPDGTIRLRFAGIPGRTYRIQATSSLSTPSWVTLDSRQAGIRGDFEFHDTDALSFPVRFYRTVSP